MERATNTTPLTAEPVDEQASAPRPSPTRWLVVLIAAVLVLGPLLGDGLHQERARWRIAAGLESWLNNDLPAALAEMDAAAALAPDLGRVYQLRSQWRIYAEDYAGALEDARRLRELDPANLDGFRLEADALVYLGRPQGALQVWLEYAKLEKERLGAVQAVTLNGVAYYRSLANTGLETGLQEVNQALSVVGPDAALIDTRGYLHFLLGDFSAAREDLNAAVAAAEKQLQQKQTQDKTYVRLGVKDPRMAAWETKLLERNVAVIRYHRGLLLEILGRNQEAEKDYRRVRQWGYEPGPQLF